jgi:hypothetical protein
MTFIIIQFTYMKRNNKFSYLGMVKLSEMINHNNYYKYVFIYIE